MGGRKTVGVIIRETFGLYKRNLLVFFVLSVIAYGATYAFGQLGLLVARSLGLDSGSLKVLFGQDSIQERFAGWGIDFFPVLVPFILAGAVLSNIITLVFSNFFSIPGKTLTVGAYDVMLGLCKGRKRSIQEATVHLKKKWLRYLGISAWLTLFIWLWSCLFLIPGLVKTYAYQLAPLLILDHPEMTVRQALKKSIEITNGYKGRLFGLAFLVSLPFGIISLIAGFLFMVSRDLSTYNAIMAIASPVISLVMIQPMTYMMVTIAYLDLKRAAIERGLLPSQS